MAALLCKESHLICNRTKTFLSMLEASRRDKDAVEKKLNNARVEIRKQMEKQKQLEHETREKINHLEREKLQMRK